MRRLFAWAAAGCVLFCGALQAAEVGPTGVKPHPSLRADESALKDVESLLRIAPSRNMGSPNRKALDQYVAERFKATGFECGTISFPTAAFIPGKAEIRLPDGTRFPLQSLAPNTAHPGNLRDGQWSGDLADLGQGTLKDIESSSPMNAAVLLDMDSHRAWVTALELGAQALIFVGSERDNSRQAAEKLYVAPLSVPRFYVSAGDGAALRSALQAQKTLPVRIVQTQPNRWANIMAADDWVIIPGAAQADKVVHIQAYKDAASIVPAATPGAQSACNLALFFRLLDHYTRHKPQCTLVFSAVSDHCNALRGEQFFLGSTYPDAGALSDELEQRQKDRKEAEFYAKVYADISAEQIGRMRQDSSMETGQALQLKTPIVDELSYQRNKTNRRISQIADQLKAGQLSQSVREALEAEKQTLCGKDGQGGRLGDLVAMMAVFQKWQDEATFEALSPKHQAELVAVMHELERKYRERAEDARSQLDQIEANARLGHALAGKTTLLYLSLDLTFANDRLGFFFQGSDMQDIWGFSTEWSTTVAPLARLSVELASKMPGGDLHFADTIQNSGGDWRSHLGDKFAMAAACGAGVVLPSVTLTTVGDTRDLLFTPGDTLQNLDAGRVATVLEFAQRFLVELLEHPDFPQATRPERVQNFNVLTYRYNLRRMDPFSVEVPTERVRDAAVIAYPGELVQTLLPVEGQVAICQLALTDRQGTAIFRAAPWPFAIEAYGFSPDYAQINAAIDAGAGLRRMSPVIANPGSDWVWDDHLALLFDCIQTDLVGLNNPSTRSPAQHMILLDAAQESSPEHYGIAGIKEDRTKFVPIPGDEGIGCVFTDEGIPIKVISTDFLLINSTPERPDGVGYLPGDPRLRTITYTAAKDIQSLNGVRSRRIENKGVSNLAADELYAQAVDLVKRAEAQRAAGRQGSFFSTSVEALSTALRSYLMVRTTTMDLIKAVAVFLALVIPFCLFLTRLVTPWTDIRAQIASFLVIFTVMALSLALLHPAFSLSQTPMMVLLAFIMVGLAIFVMLILYTRFDAGLQKLVEEAQGVESSESSRKMLAGVAFSVGVNNMRRRVIRTTLTAATIVLVTFTMLSVISVGQSLVPYRRKTEANVPYNGVLFAKPGMAPISASTALSVVGLFKPYGTVVLRTWTQRLDSYGGYLLQPVTDPAHPDKTISLDAVVGVQMAENGFITPMPLVAGRWFSSDSAAEIVLSAETASYLGIAKAPFVERTLVLRNRKVRLVGLLDDAKLATIGDLARLMLLPLKSIPDLVTHTVSETGAMVVSEEDAMAGPAPSAQSLRSQEVAFVPVDFARELPDTSYRSIALKTEDAASAWAAANHFVDATGILTYVAIREPVITHAGVSLQAHQYSLGAPVGTTIGGAGKVVIPICLAATIILNTMLGTVMERRKEIAVYNSIGLNPTHVFVFFVAEAVVFGMIGSVAGYLIGQGLAQVIVHFHWLPGVNLNYSSMAVMLVIFAAIVTVVVSTLYPAYIATRAAVPSGQRRWKLPPPAGDELHLDFPFSYGAQQLPGVLAYLQAFMDLNSEASSGRFLTQDARFGFVHDVDDRKVLAMTYSVTPVPFDLGVNQRMEVYGYYRPRVRAYVVAVVLTRLKGDKKSWLTVNEPFLESLRARLLSWRSQSSANQEQFRRQGEAMFAEAREFPVLEKAAP